MNITRKLVLSLVSLVMGVAVPMRTAFALPTSIAQVDAGHVNASMQPTLRAAVVVSRSSLPSIALRTDSTRSTPVSLKHSLAISVVGLALIGAIQTVTADKDSRFVNDTTRQQYNKLAAWLYYTNRNGMISTTVATFPGIAIGTTTTKVKTTNATVLLNAGAVNAFGITDDAWTLTGAVLAASMFRKYLLLADAADARTVQASTDSATAAGCQFTNLPADGQAIVGMITVGTDGSHTFTPGTTALNAAGITTTYYDGMGDDAALMFAQVLP